MIYLDLPTKKDAPAKNSGNDKNKAENATRLLEVQDAGTPENDNRPSWTHYRSNLKDYLKGFRLPKFLKDCINDPDVSNYTYTALSFFINTTLKRPAPQYTWIDLPVPDQLIDVIGADQITIDGTGKTISIYR